jgi:hypothetical protein
MPIRPMPGSFNSGCRKSTLTTAPKKNDLHAFDYTDRKAEIAAEAEAEPGRRVGT